MCRGFFQNSNFFQNGGHFYAIFLLFLPFCPKKLKKNGCHFENNWNFEKSLYTFLDTIIIYFQSKLEVDLSTQWLKNVYVVQKMAIFSIKGDLLLFHDTYPYVFTHKMTTNDNWMVIEPILETRDIGESHGTIYKKIKISPLNM